MAAEKVGIYQKRHEPVPSDKLGNPLPSSDKPRKHPFRWAVRVFGSRGKWYSRSFAGRKEIDQSAESTQATIHDVGGV